MRRLLFLCSLLSLSGCSKFLEKFGRLPSGASSQVRFSSGREPGRFSASTYLLDGGLMVYATKIDPPYKRFAFHLDHENDPKEFSLPNGRYYFRTVGYTGAGMSGTVKCGYQAQSAPVELVGTPAGADATTVALNLAATNCLDNEFSDSGFGASGSPPALEMVFCDSAVSLAGKSYGSTCAISSPNFLGQESTRFLRSSASAGQLYEHFDYDSLNSRIVYIANPIASGRKELYSVKLDGTGTLRLNDWMSSDSRTVERMAVVLNRSTGQSDGKVVYMSDGLVAGQMELYLANTDASGTAQKISGAIAGSLASPGVKSFVLSPDGNKVVFVGQMDSTNVNEVYMVDLDATLPNRTKISHSSPTGNGISTSNYSAVQISPDSAYVVFTGEFATSGKFELFSVPIGGGTIKKISHTSPVTSSSVRMFRINHNSSKVVWLSDANTYDQFESFASEIYPATVPTIYNISGTVSYTAGSTYFRMEVSKSSDLVAYTVAKTTSNELELWVADFSTLGSISTVAALDSAAITISNNNIGDIRFVANAGNTVKRVVFLADSTSSGKYELYSHTLGGSTVKVSHSALSTGITPGGAGTESNLQVKDVDTAYYLGDTGVDPGELELYTANLGGAAANATAAGIKTPSGTDGISSISASYGKVFYTYNSSNAQLFLPRFLTPGSGSTDLIGALSVVDDYFTELARIMTPPADESMPGLSSPVFFKGKPTGASSSASQDYFIIEDYSVSGEAPVRLTTMSGGTNGAGHFQLHLLSYESDGSTTLQYATPAISSPCLNPPGTDGTLTSHGYKIPPGAASSTNPIAVAIDIYPHSYGCTGDYQRIVLPWGIANPSASNYASKLKLTSSSGNFNLFVKD